MNSFDDKDKNYNRYLFIRLEVRKTFEFSSKSLQ